jgi:hypothetical protein
MVRETKMIDEKAIAKRFHTIEPYLDERMRRLFVANESLIIGYGGVSLLSRITGLTRNTIMSGCEELKSNPQQNLETGKMRKQGGGRKREIDKDPKLVEDLEKLIEPATRGNPELALKWTSKSTYKLADALKEMGHKTSSRMVGVILKSQKYSLKSNQKSLENSTSEDRDKQFEYINFNTKIFQMNGNPVISVDTKKKELVGEYKNNGKEYSKEGTHVKVKDHDFIDKEKGKVNPYGVYDVQKNQAWVSVGTDNDTAAFAIESIRRWWNTMGKEIYRDSKELLITADGGGSNGSRVRLWKVELQKFANETGLIVTLDHFPPGTSKWNKVEHRLFSCISMNWRGRPLISHEVIVNLIASTTTKKGLKVMCDIDENKYPQKIKVSDNYLDFINIKRYDFHGEWNYTISPQKPT